MAPQAKTRILIADDARVDAAMLVRSLEGWGYAPEVCVDGTEVWDRLDSGDLPGVLILDWNMPGYSGVELCRHVRDKTGDAGPYIILLTGRAAPEELAKGLEAGANDFVTKPFDPVVLQARVRNAVRTRDLQDKLADRVRALEEALANVKRLEGLLPICSYCKRVRKDEGYWDQVDAYIAERTDARFTHSICPHCYEDVVEPELRALEAEFDATTDLGSEPSE